VVIQNVYDQYGREAVKYLPYAINSDGKFRPAALAELASFNATQFPDEQYFYNRTVFEPSPLNTVQAVYAPGNSWTGSNRGMTFKNWSNTTTDDIRIWTVTDIVNSFGSYVFSATYNAGTLFKSVTIDEHGKQNIEFKDKEGRVILKKVQFTAPADNGTGSGYDGWLCTYYVYDDHNNLRLVIQPKGVELLSNSSWSGATLNNILAEQCFRYEYDSRDRMVRKKVPGAGEVWMVYDQWDRLVLTQDANLRINNKWLLTKYDQLNRPVMTGFYTNTTYTTQSSMQGYLNTQNMGRYEIYNPAVVERYSLNNSFPVVSLSNLLTITFYDDYLWCGWHGPAWDTKDNKIGRAHV
jgi:hypothetical protein